MYANEQEVASSRRPTPWPVPGGRPLLSSHGAMAAMPETLDRHGAAGLRFAPECARGHRRRQCRCRLGRVGRRWVPRRSRVLGAPGVHTVLFGSLLQPAGRPKQCLQFDRDGAASRVHVRWRKGLPVYCAFTVSVCENHYRTPDDLAGWTPFLPRDQSPPGRDETDRRSRGSCRTRLSAPQDGAGPDRVKNLSKRTDVRTSQQ